MQSKEIQPIEVKEEVPCESFSAKVCIKMNKNTSEWKWMQAYGDNWHLKKQN